MTEASGIEQPELLKSPGWDARADSTGFIEYGFPFEEGFPAIGSWEYRRFTLIVRSGERCPARVDFSTQYRAEGLNWTLEEPALGHLWVIGQGIVAAWHELLIFPHPEQP